MAEVRRAVYRHHWGGINYDTTVINSESKPDSTVLLIHGNSFCNKIWRPIIQDEEFVKNHRVIAVDLLGHGQSQRAEDPSEAYTMLGYARALVDFVENFDSEKPIENLIIVGTYF
jgi:pimeloyl-ACP methyl ester carboxylesterase